MKNINKKLSMRNGIIRTDKDNYYSILDLMISPVMFVHFIRDLIH